MLRAPKRQQGRTRQGVAKIQSPDAAGRAILTDSQGESGLGPTLEFSTPFELLVATIHRRAGAGEHINQ